MATSYTSLLGLALPVTGELQGTWGDTVNNSITSLLDTAVAGTTTLSTDGDVTLTTTTGASNQARQAIILCSGARTAQRTITAPAQSKIYTVINATTGGFSVKVVGAGPTTGVTIAAGESALIAWNGSDFIKISNTGGAGTFTNLTVTGNLTVNSLTNTRVPYASTSGLLVDSANMTFNGTRLTVADLADSGLTPTRVVFSTTGGALTDSANLTFDGTNLTLGGGTANGVAYLNGSKVLTTGSALTFTGTRLGIGEASPVNALTVKSGNGDQVTINNAGERFTQFTLQNNGTSKGALWVDNTNSLLELFGYSGMSLTFSANGSEQMRLTSTGLGIGTSSPVAKLGVAGNVFISGASPYIAFDTTQSGSTPAFVQYASSSLIFGAGSAERMRLDSSGNLGLGVTPSATSSIYKNFQTGGAVLMGGAGGIDLYLNGNATFNGGWKYINNGAAARYSQNDVSPGTHTWFTAPSGTAGNAISFTQAMTLDASGRLQIGTTSAQAGSTVSVKGGSVRVYNGQPATVTYDLGPGAAGGDYAYLSWNNTSGSQELKLYSDAGFISFYANAAERARITSLGQFMVGSVNDDGRMTISGANGFSGNGLSIYETSTGSNRRLRMSQETAGFTYNATFSTGGNAHIWQIGNAEAMRIDSSSNLQFNLSTGENKVNFNVSGSNFSSPTLPPGVTIYSNGAGDNTGTALSFKDGTGAQGIAAIASFRLSTSGGYARDLRFYTNDTATTNGYTERARITSGGTFLIKQTSAIGGALEVGGFNSGSFISSTGIGVSGNSHFQGGIRVDGIPYAFQSSWTVISDSRTKNVSGAFAGGLTEICALEPVRFTYNGKAGTAADGVERIGLIADSVQPVMPYCVGSRQAKLNDGDKEDTTILSLDTSPMLFAMINAIKEQQAIIEQLKADVAALKGA